MAMHTGVTSARAVSKLCSSPTLSRSPSSNKLVRRRGKGSLVRSRAFIWSKEDLQKLHELAKRPRHEVVPDVVDHHALTKSPSEPTSPDSNSSSTELDDMHHHHQTTFAGAVDQYSNQPETPPSQNKPLFRSVNHSTTPSVHPSVHPPISTAATTSKPPLQHMYRWNNSLAEPPQNLQISHHHHSVMLEPSSTNPSNLAVVSGITARLIDLTL